VQRVRGLFFDIVLGGFTSLIDSSGSGKATLLNMIFD
jgi:ABC-type nitrate/sulfonate/bicarbonate transport system ATPase subunit